MRHDTLPPFGMVKALVIVSIRAATVREWYERVHGFGIEPRSDGSPVGWVVASTSERAREIRELRQECDDGSRLDPPVATRVIS